MDLLHGLGGAGMYLICKTSPMDELVKSGVVGNSGRVTEMGNAVEGLANGNEPLYYRIRRPTGRSLQRKSIYTES